MRMTRRDCFGFPLVAVFKPAPPEVVIKPITDWTQENRDPVADIRALLVDVDRRNCLGDELMGEPQAVARLDAQGRVLELIPRKDWEAEWAYPNRYPTRYNADGTVTVWKGRSVGPTVLHSNYARRTP